MNIGHLNAIITKDIKDTIRNFQVLILFLVFPVIGFVMTQSIKDASSAFFISIFATMHFVFTPIVVTASLISEEKEKNTLRVLRMSGISSIEFMISTTLFVLLLNIVTGCTFIGMTDMEQARVLQFIVAGIIGCLISIIIGICVGTFAKSSSAANGLAVPAGMMFSFLPMLSSFNEGLEKITKFLYGQQISYLIEGNQWSVEMLIVIICNFFIAFMVYCYLYNKSKQIE